MVGQVPLEHFVSVRILAAQPERSSQFPVLSSQKLRTELGTENRELRTEVSVSDKTAVPPGSTSAPSSHEVREEGAPLRGAMASTATAADKKQHVEVKSERKPHLKRHDEKFKVFCGTANIPLCEEICADLGIPVGQRALTRFSDGEVYVQIQENVRGADVFVVQPTCNPVDQHLMELLLMIDALTHGL